MWQFIHYATPGRSHIKNNIPCQDKTYVLNKRNVHVIALSDGAGSARLSHFGAQESVRFIAEYMTEHFDEYVNGDKEKLLLKIQKKLMLKTKKHKCSIADLACTLLCVAVKDNQFILLHVGDGVIGCLKNNALEILSTPDNGEFANTTSFVTSKNALSAMKYIVSDASYISGFVLMSDGTQASLYSKRDNMLAPVLKDIMQSDLSISKLQIGLQNSFEKTIKNNTSDDCSIAFAIKRRSVRGYDISHHYPSMNAKLRRRLYRKSLEK